MYRRSWVRPSSLLRALQAGHDVIQSPDSHFYFNFSQGKLPADPAYKPHGSLLAEVAWRPAELRCPEDFLRRLSAHYGWFEAQGINYRREDGTPAHQVQKD